MEKFLIALGCSPKGFTTVKLYNKELTEKPKLGDLFLVKRASSSGGSVLGYYHAGVYCSEEEQEIIHFTFSSCGSGSFNSISGEGGVSKINVEVFYGEDKFVVYRKDNGIPENFKAKVREAMKKKTEYKLLEYNCIHFALELLDVESKTIDEFIKRILKIMQNKSTEMEMSPLNP